MGFGGSVSITEVTFDRNQYYSGDQCNVKIVCDNSKCNVGVKSFKLKLKRKIYASGERISAVGDRVKETLKQSKYIYSHKDVDHNCGPKLKVERIVSFQIPLIDPDLP